MAATNSPLTFAIIGCGARARAYMEIAMNQPELHRVTAVADPVPDRREFIAGLEHRGDVASFECANELLAEPKLADVAVIATQDRNHFEQACKAMEKGYDLVLEKPAAASVDEVMQLKCIANQLGRKVVLCFVLRYTPFYQKVKAIVDSGRLGRVLDIQMVEGVEPWHFSHSFVRGHWANSAESTPMMVAKCSHDTDIMSWLADSRCVNVSSNGETGFFKSSQAPAGATPRCTDACKHRDTCSYSAERYATDKRDPWLPQIMPKSEEASTQDVMDWVENSPWGRCVFYCDNDAPDHQNTLMSFESGVTGSLLLTAFEEGRRIYIRGTEAQLQGSLHADGEAYRLFVRDHFTGRTENFVLGGEGDEPGYASHGGGDEGLVKTLYPTFKGLGETAFHASLLDESIDGHLIAFASEKARLSASTISIEELHSKQKDEKAVPY